eukprot:1157263-Pelagomonas_calceolata.AAC.21
MAGVAQISDANVGGQVLYTARAVQLKRVARLQSSTSGLQEPHIFFVEVVPIVILVIMSCPLISLSIHGWVPVCRRIVHPFREVFLHGMTLRVFTKFYNGFALCNCEI